MEGSFGRFADFALSSMGADMAAVEWRAVARVACDGTTEAITWGVFDQIGAL